MATKNTKKMRGDKIQIGVWISKEIKIRFLKRAA